MAGPKTPYPSITPRSQGEIKQAPSPHSLRGIQRSVQYWWNNNVPKVWRDTFLYPYDVLVNPQNYGDDVALSFLSMPEMPSGIKRAATKIFSRGAKNAHVPYIKGPGGQEMVSLGSRYSGYPLVDMTKASAADANLIGRANALNQAAAERRGLVEAADKINEGISSVGKGPKALGYDPTRLYKSSSELSRQADEIDRLAAEFKAKGSIDPYRTAEAVVKDMGERRAGTIDFTLPESGEFYRGVNLPFKDKTAKFLDNRSILKPTALEADASSAGVLESLDWLADQTKPPIQAVGEQIPGVGVGDYFHEGLWVGNKNLANMFAGDYGVVGKYGATKPVKNMYGLKANSPYTHDLFSRHLGEKAFESHTVPLNEGTKLMNSLGLDYTWSGQPYANPGWHFLPGRISLEDYTIRNPRGLINALRRESFSNWLNKGR